jgi:predicted N-acyltransferase
MRLDCSVVHRIADLPALDWDALDATAHPFTSHAFLSTLEETGCVGQSSGWVPQHLVWRSAGGQLAAAIPLYLKAHSWGEFVFDWSWAQAYQRAGRDYYPKLLCAIPYTPVTGPRLLVRHDLDLDVAATRAVLATTLRDVAADNGLSGVHVNYTLPDDQRTLEELEFLRREDCRFRWANRGYRDFDDFLDGFRADKRKKVRRERRRVAESGIAFRTLHGDEIAPALWRTLFSFSERTFLAHGNAHYLNAGFFIELARLAPASVVVMLAERDNRPLAAAIFVRGTDELFGRYWGTASQEDSLHFEACYYQGIDYCIRTGLAAFDPGTQGEHKLAAAFAPTVTTSAHWLAEPTFTRAIGHYLERERAAVAEYVASAREHLPFHHGGDA